MLNFPRKKIRAQVIAHYLRECDKVRSGYRGVVCFSCGNASQALKDQGLNVLAIAPGQDLKAERWFFEKEINEYWPEYLDATSGHLPGFLMARLGMQYKNVLGPLSGTQEIMCGSGETLVALAMAYPDVEWTAIYDNSQAPTTYNPLAPLNNRVMEVATTVYRL